MKILDISLLENIQTLADGRIRARCPACAAEGRDNKGEHLMVFSDGRYGCAVHPGDKPHRALIARLAGRRTHSWDDRKISIRPKKW